MVQTAGMQHAMDKKMRKMMLKRFVLQLGFIADYWQADDQIGMHLGWCGVIKSQDIGSAISIAELPVQLMAFFSAHYAQRELGIGALRRQTCQNQAAHFL